MNAKPQLDQPQKDRRRNPGPAGNAGIRSPKSEGRPKLETRRGESRQNPGSLRPISTIAVRMGRATETELHVPPRTGRFPIGFGQRQTPRRTSGPRRSPEADCKSAVHRKRRERKSYFFFAFFFAFFLAASSSPALSVHPLSDTAIN